MKTVYEYIAFVHAGASASHKTQIYGCRNRKGNDNLGVVKWNAGWRQYCFYPKVGMLIFSAGCLSDISDFITTLNILHKGGVVE